MTARQFAHLLGSIFGWIFRSVVRVLTGIVCLLLLLSAYSDYINPKVWVFPSFMGLFFALVLVFSLLWWLVVVLLRRWKTVVVMTVVLLLVIDPASRICAFHIDSGPKTIEGTRDNDKTETIKRLKVFSFNTNIMGQTHLSRIKEHIPVMDVIRESGADIVCLQEYGFTLKKGGHTELQLRDQLRDIYPYYDYTPNNGRKALGIAIFSKYPIRKGTRIDKRKKDYFSAMYYQVEIKGERIGIVNMHMRSNQIDPKDRLLAEEMIGHFETDSLQRLRNGMMRSFGHALRLRADEAAMMSHYLLDNHPKEMPLLVCGDMNDTPISYCYRSLCQAGLSDTWKEVGQGIGSTYRKHYFWFRIDHIFHNHLIRPLQMRVRKDILLSDHYPIEATFQILPE